MRSAVRKYGWLVGVALVVLLLDQATKYVVLSTLTTALDGPESGLSVYLGPRPEAGFDGYHYRPKDPIVISTAFFRLRYAENLGAAFGLFRSLPAAWRGPMFHLVALGAVVLLSSYFSKLTGDRKERFAKLGLPLVLGGALGNYLDRLTHGFVVDYLEVHWFEKAYWPAFNVADSAVVVGVGLLLIDSFVRKEQPAPEPASSRAG